MAGTSYRSPDVWGRRENEAMAVTARKYNPGFLTDNEPASAAQIAAKAEDDAARRA